MFATRSSETRLMIVKNAFTDHCTVFSTYLLLTTNMLIETSLTRRMRTIFLHSLVINFLPNYETVLPGVQPLTRVLCDTRKWKEKCLQILQSSSVPPLFMSLLYLLREVKNRKYSQSVHTKTFLKKLYWKIQIFATNKYHNYIQFSWHNYLSMFTNKCTH